MKKEHWIMEITFEDSLVEINDALMRSSAKTVGPLSRPGRLSVQNAGFRLVPIRSCSSRGSMQVISRGLWRFCLHGFLVCLEFTVSMSTG